ncbi:MAG: OprO/OprP family phosphate-selective porin [Rhodothermaceae bacterium]|nr:OprO/OprP family phosphate-selective porin [Rhodothermaceae bacterium]
MFDISRIKGPVLILPILLLLFTLLTGNRAFSQSDRAPVITLGDDVRFRLGGTFQPRFTYDQFGGVDDAGNEVSTAAFGIRRARLRLYGQIGSDIVIFFQMEGSGTSTQLMDIRVAYRLYNDWFIRAGRFVGAQPRVFAITSHSSLDVIERPAIGEVWARGTLGADGRDYGVELYYKTSDAELRLFAHNGANNDNFRPNTGGNRPSDNRGFNPALSAYASYNPSFFDGLEVGLFGGYNPSENSNTAYASPFEGRKYSNYSGHIYWGADPGSQPVRIKADYLGIRYKSFLMPGTDGTFPQTFQQTVSGASLFASVMPSKAVEAFTRVEYIDFGHMDDTYDTFLTFGATYSMSAARGKAFGNARLTLAWSGRYYNESQYQPRNTITLQSQFFF